MSWSELISYFRLLFSSFLSWLSTISNSLLNIKIFCIGFYISIISFAIYLVISGYHLFFSSKRDKLRNKNGGGEIT